MTRSVAIAISAATLVLALPSGTAAVCCPIGPPDQFIRNSGQINLVVRDGGDIRLVPNIRFSGDADDFALIVPTPALPVLTPVSRNLWDEAARLTRPAVRRRSGSDGLNCSGTLDSMEGDIRLTAEDALIVHSQLSVGAFEATIVSSTDPTALVTWLTDNGYLADSTVTSAFDPLVADGWFFTAMKLRSGTPVPSGGWDTTVDPVEFRYPAAEFDLPLDVVAINSAPAVPMTVYAVDARRTALPGFRTRYANGISGAEAAAIAEQYPTLAPYVEAGGTLTRLDRTFQPGELTGTLRLAPAATDDEFREVAHAPGVPADLLLLATPFLWFKLASRRRRTCPRREFTFQSGRAGFRGKVVSPGRTR